MTTLTLSQEYKPFLSFEKSSSAIYHINILKKKNHMIISVDAEKVLEKKSKIHF